MKSTEELLKFLKDGQAYVVSTLKGEEAEPLEIEKLKEDIKKKTDEDIQEQREKLVEYLSEAHDARDYKNIRRVLEKGSVLGSIQRATRPNSSRVLRYTRGLSMRELLTSEQKPIGHAVTLCTKAGNEDAI